VQYVRLGSAGVKVSRVCLGMMSYGDPAWRAWVLDEEHAKPLVARAVDAGVTFFDTADVYSHGVSEEITGRLLRAFFNRRDEYVLATKVYSAMGPGPNERGLSRKHVMSAIDASLRRLGTDHVDLYQVHRWDSGTPIEETVQALDDIVRAGKARYVGASSMFAWQFAKAQFTAKTGGWTPFVSMQNHYNLLYREEEREMIPLCRDLGVGVIPWSPLARGTLTGSRRRDGVPTTTRAASDDFATRLYQPSDFHVVDRVTDLAAKRGIPAATVALAWLLHKPDITAPIVGATRTSHIDDAVSALSTTLTSEDMTSLEELYQPHAVAGHQ
jgi:aryl-alcohol dehydrogenase-like predicted oxidoreductase